MRSGVIAQKVGMTRIFTEAGEHIPVTVLKLENVQVLAHRTDEKNGYTALQLGAGSRKASRVTRAERGSFAVAKVEPKRKLAEFRVSPDNLIEVGAEITADHFVKGQIVDVTGTNQGKGFQGAMKRWNFAGLRATHGVSVTPPQPRLDRPAPGPRQGLQGQEDGRPHGRHARHHAEPRGGRRPTSERGLVLVRGAVPGSKGGWVLVRDAVKRPLPRTRPSPAPSARPQRDAAEAARSRARGAEVMKAAVKTLGRRRAPARSSSTTRSSASSRARISSIAWCAISC